MFVNGCLLFQDSVFLMNHVCKWLSAISGQRISDGPWTEHQQATQHCVCVHQQRGNLGHAARVCQCRTFGQSRTKIILSRLVMCSSIECIDTRIILMCIANTFCVTNVR